MQAFVIAVILKVLSSDLVQAQLDKFKQQILEWIREELKSWVPLFVKTLVASVAQAAGQLVVNTEDKITDIIPGQLDDQVLDPIVRPVLDQIGQWTGLKF